MAGLVTGESIVNPDEKLTGSGINLILSKATKVDINQKRVQLTDGHDVPYDKLVLATGAKPFLPPIEGCDLEGVMTLRTLPDAETIKTFLQEKNPRRPLFIGAGFITLEVASLLVDAKPDHYEIKVVELLDDPLPLMLDSDMASTVREYLEAKGFNMLMGEKVTRILGKDGTVSGVELASGTSIEADLVFVNVGAKPDLELAKDIGLEMGRFGIKVNKFLETSNPDIMACGDNVDKEHFVTKRPTAGQLRGPAVIQGRLVAKRLAGYDIEFPGVLNAGSCKIFEKLVGSTGLNERQAKEEGFNPVCAVAESRSKHGMIPGFKPWKIKLVFDKDSQMLLGGQIVSDAIAPVKEIDTLSALILGGKTIPDLTTLMCAGNPDISSEPSLEPIAIAAEQALQKLKRS